MPSAPWLMNPLERLPHKRRQAPCVDVLERRFTQRIVPARERGDLMVEAIALELRHHLAREFRRKSQIVLRINDQRLPLESRELLEVRHGADGGPQSPQAFQIDLLFQAFADVPRGLPVPGHVRYISGRMIERS